MHNEGIPMSAVEHYVVDTNGNTIAIILPLTEYQHLKEDLHDPAMIAKQRDEGTISLAGQKKACDVRQVIVQEVLV